MIATDHAPHTREEKAAGIWDAPSGVPGVETALPLLLAEARTGDIPYERVRDLTAANPAEIFGLPNKGRIEEGYDADLVLVDPGTTEPIRAERLHTACDWTPFEGWTGVFPELTMVRGTVVYERDPDDRPGGQSETFADPIGENVRGEDRSRTGPDTAGATGDADGDESIADLAADVVEEQSDDQSE